MNVYQKMEYIPYHKLFVIGEVLSFFQDKEIIVRKFNIICMSSFGT
jgi:hypothetical protein